LGRAKKDVSVTAEEATPHLMELAKSFTNFVQQVAPDSTKAYFRFCVQSSVSESKASYVHPDGVELFDAVRHSEFFHAATAKGREVLTALGKSEGLFVLIADPNFDYEIKFEFRNLDKWSISKLKGGSGIPAGVEA
jgi:hypothetical protein